MGELLGALRRRFRDTTLPRRVAWLSPMPPAPTGIATYSRAVLEGLERTGLPSRHPIEPIWPVKGRHDATIRWYGVCVYHLGNNIEFHRDIYRHAIRTPGLVVVHDLALDDFVNGLVAEGDVLGRQAVREALRGRGRVRSADALANEPLRIPWIAHAARRARGIVVHSEFARRYLRDLGCRTPVWVVPHPVPEREGDVESAMAKRPALRAPLETRGMRALVGVFGDLNAAKAMDLVCEAVRRLPQTVHLALIGRRIDGSDVDSLVRGSGLGTRVTVHTDVPDAEFLAWMCAADVVVDLRHPHRGEVSGSLVRAMQCGRPTIVSRTGTYRDLPGDAVVHVSPGRLDPVELAGAIEGLVRDPAAGDRIGRRAKALVHERSARDDTALGFAEAIEGTLALLRDPNRQALARWAGALADIGVTDRHLAEGYGLAYARALDELASGSAGGTAPSAEPANGGL